MKITGNMFRILNKNWRRLSKESHDSIEMSTELINLKFILLGEVEGEQESLIWTLCCGIKYCFFLHEYE